MDIVERFLRGVGSDNNMSVGFINSGKEDLTSTLNTKISIDLYSFHNIFKNNLIKVGLIDRTDTVKFFSFFEILIGTIRAILFENYISSEVSEKFKKSIDDKNIKFVKENNKYLNQFKFTELVKDIEIINIDEFIISIMKKLFEEGKFKAKIIADFNKAVIGLYGEEFLLNFKDNLHEVFTFNDIKI